jgi:hypothetical protein
VARKGLKAWRQGSVAVIRMITRTEEDTLQEAEGRTRLESVDPVH